MFNRIFEKLKKVKNKIDFSTLAIINWFVGLIIWIILILFIHKIKAIYSLLITLVYAVITILIEKQL